MSPRDLSGAGAVVVAAGAAPDLTAGGVDLWVPAPAGPARTHQQADLVTTGNDPHVIDGEVTGSWFPRPMLPMLAGSAAMLAVGLAALVREVVR